MQTVIIIVHLIIVLALIGVVLLQRSEGGLGLGGGGGGVSGFMTGRGQTNALTRATAILAGSFFLTSLVLAWMAAHNRAPRSILDTVPGAPASQQQAPSGQGPGILDQLQRMQGGQGSDAPGGTAPAAPSAPAPSTAPDAPLPTGPIVPQSR
jgi:preprotein translocase subunit SecG